MGMVLYCEVEAIPCQWMTGWLIQEKAQMLAVGLGHNDFCTTIFVHKYSTSFAFDISFIMHVLCTVQQCGWMLNYMWALCSACVYCTCTWMFVSLPVPATSRHFCSVPVVSACGRYYCIAVLSLTVNLLKMWHFETCKKSLLYHRRLIKRLWWVLIITQALYWNASKI